MTNQILIENTLNKLKQLPESRIQEVNDFIDFLMTKLDDFKITEGIQKMAYESKSFEFLNEEDNIYTVQDLKEKYK